MTKDQWQSIASAVGAEEITIEYLKKRCPFYHLVPKDVGANLRFRISILKWASESRANQEALWCMCARDPLFFVNVLAWLFEPRPEIEAWMKNPSPLPFVTYAFQDMTLLVMERSLGRNDVGIEKSRDMGATWMVLVLFLWRWLFHDRSSMMVASRNEEQVDSREESDTLFWKLDFMLSHLPAWMRPATSRVHLRLSNDDNGSAITGTSTTANMGRGGRKLAIFPDELASFGVEDGYAVWASTQFNSPCRIVPSTPSGAVGIFYDIMKKMKGKGIKRLRLHWTIHPVKRRGLYRAEGGKLKLLDQGYSYPPDYEFIHDGKVRSPYYDWQCGRSPNPQWLGKELDIDYLASDFQFFDAALLQVIEMECVQPPIAVGDILVDRETRGVTFLKREGGPCKLWRPLTVQGRPPDSCRYVVGIDAGAGTGASDSSMTVFDRELCEQVAEYVSNEISPQRFGELAIAMCHWFGFRDGLPAFMIWEANGTTGGLFGARVVELGFSNIYLRRVADSVSRRETDKPGYWNQHPHNLLSSLQDAMRSRQISIRSARVIAECRQYVHVAGGGVVHSATKDTLDPATGKGNHGDSAISAALCWQAMRSQGWIERPSDAKIPENCLANRRARSELEERVRQEQAGGWTTGRRRWWGDEGWAA